MKSSKLYKHICNFDVNEVKTYLPNEDNPLWFKNIFRQKLYKDHDKTLSIIFKWDSNNDGDKSFINKKVIDTQLGKSIENILVKILKYYPKTKLSKTMLTLLPPKTKVKEHIDGGILENVHRIHVPIVSNKECIFNIDKKDYYFKEGYCFEFDNTRSHYVNNQSNNSRIHLIIDLIKL